MSLLPKEHGAYVQLGIALFSGLFLGHGELEAWSQAFLTACLFLGSEPALVLLGRRGSTIPPAHQVRACRLVVGYGGAGLLAGVFAWWGAPLHALVIPSALAAGLAGLALARREHSTVGELLAAWALSSAAYPVAVLGGVSPSEAGLFASILAAVQSTGTVIVRAHLAALQKGALPGLRVIPVILALALVGVAQGHPLTLTLLPSTGVAIWVAMAPPTRMRRLGWILTIASIAGVTPVLLMLR